MTALAAETSTATTTKSPTSTARTYYRNECFLGPVHGIAFAEARKEDGMTRTSYELNVLDGWVRVHEWTDESGVVWAGESRTQSRVRAVLDAAPEHAEFVANVHLAWANALEKAGESRQASAQRRALNSALQRHGLTLNKPPQRPARQPRPVQHATLF